MSPFAIISAESAEHAGSLVRSGDHRLPVLKAGGMDLVDHLKEGLIQPDLVVDLLRARGAIAQGMTHDGDALRMGALVTLGQLERLDELSRLAPALVQAAASAATPQIRNVATIGGNLLQRPRCWYYRASEFHCLKKGGDRCFAVGGENRYHAVFGDGPCHIVHPSNLAPALLIADGAVRVVGERTRDVPVAELYHPPSRGIFTEHNLRPDEVIESVTFRAIPASGFYAVKEKQSFDWPLVMAAASLTLDGPVIRAARVCAGAVAPVPWPLPGVEQALLGVSIDDDAALRRACSRAADGGRSLGDNGYKLRLLPVAVRRAVLRAAGRELE